MSVRQHDQLIDGCLWMSSKLLAHHIRRRLEVHLCTQVLPGRQMLEPKQGVPVRCAATHHTSNRSNMKNSSRTTQIISTLSNNIIATRTLKGSNWRAVTGNPADPKG